MKKSDPQDREKVLIQYFGTEFTNLSNISTLKAQTLHDVEIFRIFCHNIRASLKKFYEKIK